jgi:diguanylate cyclase
VDDFGTGYSSLAYLRQFPLDILKIDRAFVRNIATNETDRAVIKALIELAHALNLSVVAEGVETEDQIYWLKDLGCDVLQGYHLGRPVPAKDMESLWLA